MLFDTDLVVGMLSLVSERCRRGNQVIAMLMSGIEAVHDDSPEKIEQVSKELGGGGNPPQHCQGQQTAAKAAAAAPKLTSQHNALLRCAQAAPRLHPERPAPARSETPQRR